MANKYPHAIYYKVGFDDPTPHRFTYVEEDPLLGKMVERIYEAIDEAHYLKKKEVTFAGYNPLLEKNISSYFKWRGFTVEDNNIRWGNSPKEEAYVPDGQ